MATDRGKMVFIVALKMLVLFILIIGTADFCKGKAFLEESEKSRGKRYYNHDQSAGLHQTYDPQSNAEHWMKSKIYEPRVDGQPIYIPSLDQPGSYNEFLDAYYKAYTPAWNLVTPSSHAYNAQGAYETPVVKDTSDIKDLEYALSSPRNELEVEMSSPEDYISESDDYYAPEVVDRTNLNEFDYENPDLVINESNDLDEYDDSIFRTSLKKTDLPKPKPTHSDMYDQPTIIKTVKQNPKKHANKSTSKKPSTPKPKPQLEKIDEYEKIVHKTAKVKPNKKNTSIPKYGSQMGQKTRKKSKGKRRKPYTKSNPKTGETEYESILDPKTVDKILNEQGEKDGDLYMPKEKEKVVIKTDKKPVKNKEKVVVETDEYEPVQIIEKVKVEEKPVENKEKVVVETDEYEPVQIIEKVKVKQKTVKNKEKVVVETDEYEPVQIIEKVQVEQKKPVKNKEKVFVETDEYEPVQIIEKIKAEQKPAGNKEKVVEIDEYEPVQIKEQVVIKADQKKPIKTKEKVIIKSNSKNSPIKADTKNKPGKIEAQYKPATNTEKETVKYDTELEQQKYSLRQLNNDDFNENDSDTEDPLEDEPDILDASDFAESEFAEGEPNSGEQVGKDENTENSNKEINPSDSFLPNTNDFRGLSSMNSNVWSLLFNPKAEQNRLKQKRCITRSNETGFCTYIQNCEVPHIATSLEQLLNNACVIDDIFIGVCCPEFPVETVKVHWDQTPPDFDNKIEDEFGHNTEDCGIRSNEAAELQSWPWKAPLVSMSNGKIFCGGVVVSEDHVLTAAHCTTKIPKNQILVRLGQYDDTSGDDYAVVEIKRHAKYNPRTMQNDVALLKLGRRIMNDAHIGVVCLPEEHDKSDHDGETATLLGWRGIFGTKSRDSESLKVITNKECASMLGMKVADTLLCTETRKESERTCNADSGAPLVIEDDGKYEVVGILAWNRNDCDQRFPSTFSRVSSYTGWIKNHIS